MRRSILILLAFASTSCHRASPTWRDPAFPAPPPAAAPGLGYEPFYGTWTPDRRRTRRINNAAQPADALAAGMTFQRNGVLILDRFTRPAAGAWQPRGDDRLFIQRPDSNAPDHYIVRFEDGRLHLTNLQTGERLVFEREQ